MGATEAMQVQRDSRGVRLACAYAICLLLMTAVFGGTAQGAEFDPYVVDDLLVSVEARDGVQAKEAALSEGMERALARVFSRITSSSDAVRLGRSDTALAERLLDHMSILNERVAPQGYTARLRIVFSPLAVRGYLARRDVQVVDQPAPPILLIPVLVDDGIPTWWEDAKPWAEALDAIDMEDGLTPIRLPNNTAGDRRERPDHLLAGDRVALDTFRVRYRVHGVIVARSEIVRGRDGVAISLIGEDAAGHIHIREEVAGGGLHEAARRIAVILSDRWKQGLRGQPAIAQAHAALPVRILLQRGSEEWREIRASLEASGALTAIAVEAVSDSGANVLLWHRGAPGELADILAREGLDLFEAGGVWLLQAY